MYKGQKYALGAWHVRVKINLKLIVAINIIVFSVQGRINSLFFLTSLLPACHHTIYQEIAVHQASEK